MPRLPAAATPPRLISYGIDPVSIYAGAAHGVTYARGGAGSSVSAITGTTTSTKLRRRRQCSARDFPTFTPTPGRRRPAAKGVAIAGSGTIAP